MNWRRWTPTCVLACAIGCGCGEPVTAATVSASRTATGPVSPATGQVLTQETVTAQEGVGALLLAVDSTTREAVAIVFTPGYTGLVMISPPRSCWTGAAR
jgi:hypothetical protein